MDRQKIERFEKLGTFILGGVAGTVAGILISPRSGRELRGSMSSRAGEARERGREGYFEARERARERLAGMRVPRTAGEEAGATVGSSGEPPLQETGERPEVPVPEEAPFLRAVPPETPEEPEEATDAIGKDPEALRLRIRQTRERLRRRGPGGTDG